MTDEKPADPDNPGRSEALDPGGHRAPSTDALVEAIRAEQLAELDDPVALLAEHGVVEDQGAAVV